MPYKIERLKPIYLFILLTTIFTLGLFTEKTLVQTVFSKKERIEEIVVGDVNETMNYSFEIKWNDLGYTVDRPTSVTYNLYNVLDENNVVSTVTLTPANMSSSDFRKWVGTFNNVRKYNDDESLAKYLIKQQEIENYVQQYDVINDNGLCIEFGDNVFGGDTTKSLKIIGTKEYERNSSGYSYTTWDNYYLLNTRTNDNNFYYEDLANKTVCASHHTDKEIYLDGNDVDVDIKRIYTTTIEDTLDDVYSWCDDEYSHIKNFEFYDLKNYPTHLNGKIAKYSWNTNYGNYPGANVVINNHKRGHLMFDKYWEDEGHEDLRPSSSEYYLYRKDDQNNVIKTVTLTSSNADPNNSYHWVGNFEGIDLYDEDGQKIEFVVREKAIPNYITSYDTNDGYYVKFSDNSETGHTTAFNIYYYDEGTGRWYYYYPIQSDGGLGKFIQGNTLKIDFSNLRLYSSNGIGPFEYRDNPGVYNRKDSSIYHEIKSLVGNKYPETYHPVSVYDYFDYSYSSSLSNHAKKLYFHYAGDSWGGEYGIKVDKITPFGNELLITSRINVKDLKITKKWEDQGHESERPTSSIVDIYNSKDLNTIIKAIILTNNDRVDDNTWEVTVHNLPIYDNDLQEIEYTIIERPISGYKSIYDFSDYYNLLAVTFGDNISVYDTYLGYLTPENEANSTYTVVNCSSRQYCYTNDQYGVGNGYDIITNRSFYIPGRKIIIVPNEYRNNQRFNIVDIVPYHIDGYDEPTNKRINNMYGPIISSTTYENYPLLDANLPENTRANFVYTWKGSTVPRANATIIINKYNKVDYEFTKIWDDTGNEDARPSIVRFNIYNRLDMNAVVKTISLTSNNANPSNPNEWLGKILDLPKYNDDLSYADYVAKEEVLDKYKSESRDTYNSLCVKFGDNVFNGDDNKAIQFFVRKDGKYYMLQNTAYEYVNPSFNRNDLRNKTVCLPVEDGHYDFYIVGSTAFLNIQEITRGYKTDYTYMSTVVDKVGPAAEFINDNLPNVYNQIYLHYTWDYDEQFAGGTVITNHANMREEGYIKEFNDTGYEYNRPKELVFGLYVENDPIPKEMVTVNTSTCINNKCNIEFKNVRDKDNDNNQINYIIKEISDYGYDVTYENDKVINTANPVEVKLIKENTEGKVLSGAKLAIYNKDGDKIKEIISTNEEIKIKLLPSTYIIKEIEAPKDYSRCQDITLVVNKDGTYTQDGNTVNRLKIVNEYAKDRYDITLKKTMEGNSNKEFTFEVNIEGVEDPIEYIGDRTGTITGGNGTIKLGANQTITIKNIPVDSKYEIKEIESDYEVEIVGEGKGTLERNETIEFINTPKEEPYVPDEKEELTPITGLYNITTYIIGLLLLIASIFLIVYSKKQMKRS